ncbi:Purine-cytosine permease FCY21 [Fusarium oxysporum f. sp. albedinis]|nr:Purine-cytosine permease FCY21 [Fusarium oxysporum f. sp. albedinis]
MLIRSDRTSGRAINLLLGTIRSTLLILISRNAFLRFRSKLSEWLCFRKHVLLHVPWTVEDPLARLVLTARAVSRPHLDTSSTPTLLSRPFNSYRDSADQIFFGKLSAASQSLVQ